MSQTTTQVSKAKFIVEVSTDGNNWDDISGSSNSFAIGEQERVGGYTMTGQGDTGLTTVGGRPPLTSTLRFAYTETAGEAAEVLRGLFENGTDCYFRVTPSVGGTGKKRYTSAKGHIVKYTYSELDASSGDPQLCEVQFLHAGWTVATIT